METMKVEALLASMAIRMSEKILNGIDNLNYLTTSEKEILKDVVKDIYGELKLPTIEQKPQPSPEPKLLHKIKTKQPKSPEPTQKDKLKDEFKKFYDETFSFRKGIIKDFFASTIKEDVKGDKIESDMLLKVNAMQIPSYEFDISFGMNGIEVKVPLSNINRSVYELGMSGVPSKPIQPSTPLPFEGEKEKAKEKPTEVKSEDKNNVIHYVLNTLEFVGNTFGYVGSIVQKTIGDFIINSSYEGAKKVSSFFDKHFKDYRFQNENTFYGYVESKSNDEEFLKDLTDILPLLLSKYGNISGQYNVRFTDDGKTYPLKSIVSILAPSGGKLDMRKVFRDDKDIMFGFRKINRDDLKSGIIGVLRGVYDIWRDESSSIHSIENLDRVKERLTSSGYWGYWAGDWFLNDKYMYASSISDEELELFDNATTMTASEWIGGLVISIFTDPLVFIPPIKLTRSYLAVNKVFSDKKFIDKVKTTLDLSFGDYDRYRMFVKMKDDFDDIKAIGFFESVNSALKNANDPFSLLYLKKLGSILEEERNYEIIKRGVSKDIPEDALSEFKNKFLSVIKSIEENRYSEVKDTVKGLNSEVKDTVKGLNSKVEDTIKELIGSSRNISEHIITRLSRKYKSGDLYKVRTMFSSVSSLESLIKFMKFNDLTDVYTSLQLNSELMMLNFSSKKQSKIEKKINEISSKPNFEEMAKFVDSFVFPVRGGERFKNFINIVKADVNNKNNELARNIAIKTAYLILKSFKKFTKAKSKEEKYEAIKQVLVLVNDYFDNKSYYEIIRNTFENAGKTEADKIIKEAEEAYSKTKKGGEPYDLGITVASFKESGGEFKEVGKIKFVSSKLAFTSKTKKDKYVNYFLFTNFDRIKSYFDGLQGEEFSPLKSKVNNIAELINDVENDIIKSFTEKVNEMLKNEMAGIPENLEEIEEFQEHISNAIRARMVEAKGGVSELSFQDIIGNITETSGIPYNVVEKISKFIESYQPENVLKVLIIGSRPITSKFITGTFQSYKISGYEDSEDLLKARIGVAKTTKLIIDKFVEKGLLGKNAEVKLSESAIDDLFNEAVDEFVNKLAGQQGKDLVGHLFKFLVSKVAKKLKVKEVDSEKILDEINKSKDEAEKLTVGSLFYISMIYNIRSHIMYEFLKNKDFMEKIKQIRRGIKEIVKTDIQERFSRAIENLPDVVSPVWIRTGDEYLNLRNFLRMRAETKEGKQEIKSIIDFDIEGQKEIDEIKVKEIKKEIFARVSTVSDVEDMIDRAVSIWGFSVRNSDINNPIFFTKGVGELIKRRSIIELAEGKDSGLFVGAMRNIVSFLRKMFSKPVGYSRELVYSLGVNLYKLVRESEDFIEDIVGEYKKLNSRLVSLLNKVEEKSPKVNIYDVNNFMSFLFHNIDRFLISSDAFFDNPIISGISGRTNLINEITNRVGVDWSKKFFIENVSEDEKVNVLFDLFRFVIGSGDDVDFDKMVEIFRRIRKAGDSDLGKSIKDSIMKIVSTYDYLYSKISNESILTKHFSRIARAINNTIKEILEKGGKDATKKLDEIKEAVETVNKDKDATEKLNEIKKAVETVNKNFSGITGSSVELFKINEEKISVNEVSAKLIEKFVEVYFRSGENKYLNDLFKYAEKSSLEILPKPEMYRIINRNAFYIRNISKYISEIPASIASIDPNDLSFVFREAVQHFLTSKPTYITNIGVLALAVSDADRNISSSLKVFINRILDFVENKNDGIKIVEDILSSKGNLVEIKKGINNLLDLAFGVGFKKGDKKTTVYIPKLGKKEGELLSGEKFAYLTDVFKTLAISIVQDSGRELTDSFFKKIVKNAKKNIVVASKIIESPFSEGEFYANPFVLVKNDILKYDDIFDFTNSVKEHIIRYANDFEKDFSPDFLSMELRFGKYAFEDQSDYFKKFSTGVFSLFFKEFSDDVKVINSVMNNSFLFSLADFDKNEFIQSVIAEKFIEGLYDYVNKMVESYVKGKIGIVKGAFDNKILELIKKSEEDFNSVVKSLGKKSESISNEKKNMIISASVLRDFISRNLGKKGSFFLSKLVENINNITVIDKSAKVIDTEAISNIFNIVKFKKVSDIDERVYEEGVEVYRKIKGISFDVEAFKQFYNFVDEIKHEKLKAGIREYAQNKIINMYLIGNPIRGVVSVVPKQFVEDAKNYVFTMLNAKTYSKIVEAFTKISTFMRRSLLAPYFSFYVQNFTDATIKNIIEGVDIKNIIIAMKFLMERGKDRNIIKDTIDMIEAKPNNVGIREIDFISKGHVIKKLGNVDKETAINIIKESKGIEEIKIYFDDGENVSVKLYDLIIEDKRGMKYSISAIYDEAVEGNIFGVGVHELVVSISTIKKEVEDIINKTLNKGYVAKQFATKPFQSLLKYLNGQVIEAISRFSLYLDRRLKGYSKMNAIEEVSRIHFDYSKLTEIERNVMNNILFFYTFWRKNLEYAISLISRRLIMISEMIKVASNASITSPYGWLYPTGYIEEKNGIQSIKLINFNYFFSPIQYFYLISQIAENAVKPIVFSGVFGIPEGIVSGIKEASSEILRMTHPFFKLAVVLSTGYEISSSGTLYKFDDSYTAIMVEDTTIIVPKQILKYLPIRQKVFSEGMSSFFTLIPQQKITYFNVAKELINYIEGSKRSIGQTTSIIRKEITKGKEINKELVKSMYDRAVNELIKKMEYLKFTKQYKNFETAKLLFKIGNEIKIKEE